MNSTKKQSANDENSSQAESEGDPSSRNQSANPSPEHSPHERPSPGSVEMRLNPPRAPSSTGGRSGTPSPGTPVSIREATPTSELPTPCPVAPIPAAAVVSTPASTPVSSSTTTTITTTTSAAISIEGLGPLPIFTSNGHDPLLSSLSCTDNISRSSESGKSMDGISQQKTPDSCNKSDLFLKSGGSKSGEKKKRTSAWYNVLNPTYKSRSDDFKRLFKDLPESERLIVDYSCAMQKDILVHGRLYVSQNYFCFYANIFRWETFVLIRCRDIASMTKEKTARVIPNAIQVCTNSEKHFFTSFGARDKTYLMLFRIWQNALLEQPMSSQELWQWVHYSYGDELGLTSDDDDYVSPHSVVEDEKSLTNLSDHSMVGCKETNGDLILGEKLVHKMRHLDEDTDLFDSHLDLSCGSPGPLHMGDLPPMENGPLHKSKKSEYPTDLSDTTESDINLDSDFLGSYSSSAASEVLCVCEKHEGKEVLNNIYPLSVDQLFALTFTASKFMADLMESRKTFDVIQSPWQIEEETGHKTRQLTYTLTLNHSMAKTAQTTDQQKLLKPSKPGQLYMLSCEIVNAGIPYSDTFAVKSQYCITRVSSQESRLRVHGMVQYKKSVWGLVKSLIEKTAMQGVQDFCTDLDTALKKESERSQQTSGKKSRRRKRTKGSLLDSKMDGAKEVAKAFPAQNTIHKISPSISGLEMGSTGPSSDLVIRVILGTLVALLLLNGLLFYKLWSLEDQSLQMAALPPEFEIPLDSQHHSSENLLRLLRQQEVLHRTEAEKWKEALTDVIKLLRLMENSLSDLKNNIESYSNSAFLKSVTLASTAPKSTSQSTGQTRVEKQ